MARCIQFDADAAAAKAAIQRGLTDMLNARRGDRPEKGADTRLALRKEATAMMRDMQAGPAELDFWDSFAVFSGGAQFTQGERVRP